MDDHPKGIPTLSTRSRNLDMYAKHSDTTKSGTNKTTEWKNIQKLSKQYDVPLDMPQLKLVRLNVEPGVRRIFTMATLACMPDSRYGARPYYNPTEDPMEKCVETGLNSLQETVGYVDFDATDEYLPDKFYTTPEVTIRTTRERASHAESQKASKRVRPS